MGRVGPGRASSDARTCKSNEGKAWAGVIVQRGQIVSMRFLGAPWVLRSGSWATRADQEEVGNAIDDGLTCDRIVRGL